MLNHIEKSVWAAIVTYNSSSWIQRLIDSILASSIIPNIIVVDNASQDNTVEIVTTVYPEVKLIQCSENKGFGQACNIAMKYALEAGAEYIVQLNDDVKLAPSALSNLINAALNNPKFGILVPVNITDDGNEMDSLFAKELDKYHPPGFLSDYVLGRVKEVYEVPVLPGAVLLVKQEVLETLGGFDPLFFVGGVEYDFCLRTVISDWKVGFV
ncbi:unnamed protein product, partial [marine sediment metagenome]